MRFIILVLFCCCYICNKLFFLFTFVFNLHTIYVKQQPTKIYIMKTVSSIVENYIKTKPFY
jgi:uncharacterized protein YabE (DUF348 family)